MTAEEVEDEIDLIDLIAVLLRWKRMIISATVLAAAVTTGLMVISLLLPPERSFLPNTYTSEALMLINDAKSASGGISSLLNSSGLGGLASIAGVNLPSGSSYSQLAVYLAGTNSFLDAVTDEFGLITRYKARRFPRETTREMLKENLTAEFDDKSGVFTLSFDDTDPAFAQKVVTFAVNYFDRRFTEMGLDKNSIQKENLETNIANTYREIQKLESESQKLGRSVSIGRGPGEVPSIMLESTRIKRELDAQEQVYTQLKIQYELLKVTMASESPIFQVLEYPDLPEMKSKPSRGMISLIATFAAFFSAVLLAFILEALGKMRADPETMAKLTGKKR